MANSSSTADVQKKFLEKLKRLYWDATQREVGSMILFYNKAQRCPWDEERHKENENKNLEKILHLWIGRQEKDSKPFDTSILIQEMISKVKGRNLSISFKEFKISHQAEHPKIENSRLLARYLLQSSGFLDIDIAYESVAQSWPSLYRGKINVEKVIIPKGLHDEDNHVLRGVYCSVCRLLIRSQWFYECSQGCQDLGFLPHLVIDAQGKLEVLVLIPKDRGMKIPNNRLCLACFPNSAQKLQGGCSEDHQHKRHCEDPESPYLQSFKSRVSQAEDKARLETRLGKTTIKAAILKKLSPLFDREHYGASRHLSGSLGDIAGHANRVMMPAGTFHLAMMFGPLILETGVPRSNRGVSISPRLCSHLFAKFDEVSNLLYDKNHRRGSKTYTKRLIFYEDRSISRPARRKMMPNRTFKVGALLVEPRLTQVLVKAVYGAAFSGYDDQKEETRESIIDLFLKEAESCRFKSTMTVEAKRASLFKSSEKVTILLKSYIGEEIDKYLSMITNVLFDPATRVSFHHLTNNCQDFRSSLLTSKEFEGLFPRLPKDLGSSKTVRGTHDAKAPQYLFSFGDQIERTHALFYNQKSAVETYLNRPDLDYDLIDFLKYCVQGDNTEDSSEQISSFRQLWLVEPVQNSPSHSDEVAGHLWENPRDTLSILQSHIHRPHVRYSTRTGQLLDSKAWIRNRLLVLRQLDDFATVAGSLGASLRSISSRDSSLLPNPPKPKAFVYGNINASAHVRVISIPLLGDCHLVSYNSSEGTVTQFGRLNQKPDLPLKQSKTPSGSRVPKEWKKDCFLSSLLQASDIVATFSLKFALKLVVSLMHIYTSGGWVHLGVLGHLVIFRLFDGQRARSRPGWQFLLVAFLVASAFFYCVLLVLRIMLGARVVLGVAFLYAVFVVLFRAAFLNSGTVPIVPWYQRYGTGLPGRSNGI